MASMTKSICVVFIAAVMIVSIAPPAEGLGCWRVISYMRSCLPYVTDRGPLGGCCNGVKKLYDAASTTEDRQSACRCLKRVASSYSGINFDKAAGLPQQCGVNISFQISPSIDSSTVG